MHFILGKKKKERKREEGRTDACTASSYSEGRALSFTYYNIRFLKLIGAKPWNSQKQFVI